MTPFSKKFIPAYAKVLIRIAEGDLNTAKVLATHPGGRPENTCYLLQQALEKSLKAVICHYDLAVPMTHDLAALFAALPESAARPPDEQSLAGLTEYATVRRYEEGFYALTENEISAAVLATKKVLRWASQLILSDR